MEGKDRKEGGRGGKGGKEWTGTGGEGGREGEKRVGEGRKGRRVVWGGGAKATQGPRAPSNLTPPLGKCQTIETYRVHISAISTSIVSIIQKLKKKKVRVRGTAYLLICHLHTET